MKTAIIVMFHRVYLHLEGGSKLHSTSIQGDQFPKSFIHWYFSGNLFSPEGLFSFIQQIILIYICNMRNFVTKQ